MKIINKQITISLLILIFAFLAAKPAIAERYNVYTPTTYKQIQIVQSPKRSNIDGEAIELLVDYSGSMISWIALAKETLIYILPNIPKNSAVALRVFGGVSSSNAYSYIDSCRATRLVSYFKKENQSNIIKGLQETKAGGDTPLEFALRETVNKDLRNIKIVSANAQPIPQDKKIILVTDGWDSCGGDPCAYIRELIKTRQDIKIDVIQLGNDNTLKLKCLSNSTGGKFYKIDGNRQIFEMALEDTFNVPIGTVQLEKEKNLPPQPQHQPRPQRPSADVRGYKFIKF